jgi:hypothetical protein
MTWYAVGAAAVTVIGGAVNANKASKATDKAAGKITDAQSQSDALSQQRYLDAQKTLSPYLLSSSVANRQLINEMGLGKQYQDAEHKSRADNLASLQQQLSDLQAEQAASTASVQAQATKKKKKGGLLGAISKVTGTDNLSDLLNPIGAGKAGLATAKFGLTGKSQLGEDGKPIDNANAIAMLQKQIADEQAAIDGYSSQPQDNQAGTAYMNTPAYQGAIDAGVKSVDQGAANSGGLYSGARGVALRDVGQGVQQSFYSNYMNMLQNMANPATATNLSNIGINQAGNIGQQNIASANNVNGYNLMGTEANNAATSDTIGGLTSAFTAYMNRPQQSKVGTAKVGVDSIPTNPGWA